jgi:hypothetical protein
MGSAGQTMDPTRHNFFADSALAQQQYGHVHSRDMLNRRANLGRDGVGCGKDETFIHLF